MITVTRIAEVRRLCDEARAAGQSVGLVPTMGFFHEGHLSLMREARAASDLVVVTLFVNPLQFAPTEDLSVYPRDLAGDAEAARGVGVDVLFAPEVDEMYPEEPLTTVHVAGLGDGLCGASRPGHFDGVATVVAKLFSIIGPSTAFFGSKDAQQLAIVRRIARDLNLGVTVVGCSLVRERDGLAMSSRNVFLSPAERVAATVLSQALRRAASAIEAGERRPDVVEAMISEDVGAEPLVALDYAAVRDAHSLDTLEVLDGDVLVAVAARVGKARLIDNCSMSFRGAEVIVDLGVVCYPESEATCVAP